MKTIYILFGEMGGGKNYHGERLAKIEGYSFFDGDDVVPPEMLEKVKNFEPLTREIVQNYISVLANAIADRAEDESVPGLVVAQALYFDEDRLFLESFLNCLGFKVKFIWVRARFWRNLKQIYSRPKGLRWVLYWLMNKPFFQKPTKTPHSIICTHIVW